MLSISEASAYKPTLFSVFDLVLPVYAACSPKGEGGDLSVVIFPSVSLVHIAPLGETLGAR